MDKLTSLALTKYNWEWAGNMLAVMIKEINENYTTKEEIIKYLELAKEYTHKEVRMLEGEIVLNKIEG